MYIFENISPIKVNSSQQLSFTKMTKDKKIDLTAITWAHAVNSQQKLNEALNSSSIDMIEADIVLGRLNNIGSKLPIMAHPPATSSDISLESFLRQIMAHNEQNINAQRKGVKLDFKTIEVFDGSLDILNELVPLMTVPLWLNADIVPGPVDETETIPVEPTAFLNGCAPFGKAVLSIGWTTRWGPDYNEGAYTVQQISDMLTAIKDNNLTVTQQAITFPVRAGIAANSLEALNDLMRVVDETNKCTLTVWSSPDDKVDAVKLSDLIHSIGPDRVYLDLPDELLNSLNLQRTSSIERSAKITSLMNFGVISMCLVAASFWLQRVKF